MASPTTKRPKHEAVPEQPAQDEEHSQGEGCKVKLASKRQGSQESEEDTKPSPVDWDGVEDVDGPAYMDYKKIIMKERTPDLFPTPEGKANVSKQHSLYLQFATA